jgi:hypothetical protein
MNITYISSCISSFLNIWSQFNSLKMTKQRSYKQLKLGKHLIFDRNPALENRNFLDLQKLKGRCSTMQKDANNMLPKLHSKVSQTQT